MKRLALALLLGGCAPSHLELAKGHRQVALDAQAAGDTLTARGEMQAAITEAEASLKDEEGAEAQAWILKAWGHLALGQEEQVRPALREARQRHRGGAPACPGPGSGMGVSMISIDSMPLPLSSRAVFAM